MSLRAYGQYCGFSRALEVVGERWALLIVRDLIAGPRRFTDLHRGLPGIPTNVLSARLKELEGSGVVQRKIARRPASAIAYELTAYGRELEEAVFALGRWGAKMLGDPREGETVSLESLMIALRSTFDEKAARGLDLSYELRFGDIVFHAKIENGRLAVGEGPLPGALAVIEAGPVLKALMAREITAKAALANGSVRLAGAPEMLDRFVDLFRIDGLPEPVTH